MTHWWLVLHSVGSVRKCFLMLPTPRLVGVLTNVGKRHIVRERKNYDIWAGYRESLTTDLSLDSLISGEVFHRWLRSKTYTTPKMRAYDFRLFAGELFGRVTTMATTKGKAKGGARTAFEGEYKFVNITLTDAQQERALIVYEDVQLVWDTLVVMMRDGYKMSMSYDDRSDSFCCTLTGVRCGKPNEGLILTGWADNESDALRFALFKHTTVLEMTWVKNAPDHKRRG